MDRSGIDGIVIDYRRVLRDFRTHLEYLVQQGIAMGDRTPSKGISAGQDLGEKIPRCSQGSDLEGIRASMGDCRRCPLHRSRTHIVFGQGNPEARLVFVGEGPGEEEDLQGEPFVGPAGQLLTRIIQAIGLDRKDVYIANVVKCRPPFNRNPGKEEIEACLPFLLDQLRAIDPWLIVALGNVAAQSLLNNTKTISQLRGRFYDFHGIRLMPTYHPAFLLRNPERKRDVWEDMKKVKREYEGLQKEGMEKTTQKELNP